MVGAATDAGGGEVNWDRRVSDAKHEATVALCKFVRDSKGSVDTDGLARAIDELNKAWDGLTDVLVRQRKERDRVIRHLIDELAERPGEGR